MIKICDKCAIVEVDNVVMNTDDNFITFRNQDNSSVVFLEFANADLVDNVIEQLLVVKRNLQECSK